MKIDIDKLLDKLPLRDAMEIEERTGTTVSELFRGQASAKGLTALVWIVKRHDDPAFTWDQALDVELGEIDELDKYIAAPDDDNAADVDPTEAADDETTST